MASVRGGTALVTVDEVQVLQNGFQSLEGKEILQSLHSLAELLKKVGSKEDGLKVAELHQQLSRSTTDRQALIDSISKLSGAEAFLTSKLAFLRELASSHPSSSTPSLGSKAKTPRHIVLNCANIGCSGSLAASGSKFSWERVEKAFKFYDDEGYTVHCIIGQRLLHKAGRKISAKLDQALVVIPSRDDMRDNDDYSTILEAYKNKCEFVDNDNYRDWGLRIKDPEVLKWYGQNKNQLHVAYYFDRAGNFTPLKGATPKQTDQVKAPSSHALPAVGEKRLPIEEAGALIKRLRVDAGPSTDPAPPKEPNIQLGREIYDDVDSECLRWRVVRPTEVWPKCFDQTVGTTLRPLRTLKAGEGFKSIMQRPDKGPPTWLAIHPRGWVKVESVNGIDGTANVVRLG